MALGNSGWAVGTDRVLSSSSLVDLAKTLGLDRKGQASVGVKTRSNTADRPVATAHDSTVLRNRFKDLLDAIDPDDQVAVEAIRRPILQEIVLWEFGSDFRQHPEFAAMLDRLEHTLAVDPRAQERLSDLIRQLHR